MGFISVNEVVEACMQRCSGANKGPCVSTCFASHHASSYIKRMSPEASRLAQKFLLHACYSIATAAEARSVQIPALVKTTTFTL